MHVPSVSIRFALILEAYFRGNNALLAELFKQVEGLHGLRALYDHVELLSPAIVSAMLIYSICGVYIHWKMCLSCEMTTMLTIR